MRITHAIIATGAFVALGLTLPASASAQTCTAARPGGLRLEHVVGVKDTRVRLDDGKGAKQTVRFEYKVPNCDLRGKQFPARLSGPTQASSGIKATYVVKGSHDLSLDINFSKNTLDPGEYEFTFSSTDRALPDIRHVNIVVRATGAKPWIVGGLAFLLGLAVLVARAAAVSPDGWWTAVRAALLPKALTLPFLAGGAAAYLAVDKTVGADTWFAEGGQVRLLFVTALSAVVAAGTALTAAQDATKKSNLMGGRLR